MWLIRIMTLICIPFSPNSREAGGLDNLKLIILSHLASARSDARGITELLGQEAIFRKSEKKKKKDKEEKCLIEKHPFS